MVSVEPGQSPGPGVAQATPGSQVRYANPLFSTAAEPRFY